MAEQNWHRNLLSDLSPAKREMLSGLVDLKQENLLNSSEALDHIRRTAIVEGIVAQAQELTGSRELVPISVATNLCSALRGACQSYLNSLALSHSSCENWAVLVEHLVNEPWSDGKCSLECDDTVIWGLDYSKLMSIYMTYLNDQALLQREGELPVGALDQKRAEVIVAAILLSAEFANQKFLINQETGEAHSLHDFQKLLSDGRFGLAGPALEDKLECYELSELGLDANATPQQIHQAICSEKQGLEFSFFATELSSPLAGKGFVWADLQTLYQFSSLYQRAKSEMTLYTFEVERKLALASVISQSLKTTNGTEMVATALDNISTALERKRKLFSDTVALGGTLGYLEKITAEDVERLQYQLRIIKLNKNWLVRFFDN